jgi:hypothetical protein
MALSPEDRGYYERKLELSSFKNVVGVIVGCGTLAFPLLMFIQDVAIGKTEKWGVQVVVNLSFMGFMLGFMTSVAIYLIFKFLLEMGWLPSRR